ncbi:hypothetical protein PFLmoz3_06210 [Pseudomonas fluorescens]|uniref:Uncharacterized protein n=1 Tax=Pseudomonas fluorescens TaxID=294 RepID=A0A109KLV0_PSEFL|nr:hypothetical protein PFLmoz3_06210 [Pseudomonas fluorescens]
MAGALLVGQQRKHITAAQYRTPRQILQAIEVLLAGDVAAGGFRPGLEERFSLALPLPGLIFIPAKDLAIYHGLERQAGTDRFSRHRVDRTTADGVVALKVTATLAKRGQVGQQVSRCTAGGGVPGTQRALGLRRAAVTAQRGHGEPGMHALGAAFRAQPGDGLVEQCWFWGFRCPAHRGVIPRRTIPRGRPLSRPSTCFCQ